MKILLIEGELDPYAGHTAGNSAAEIRRVFQMFSQSAVQASQTATFGSTALAGFVS